MISPWQFSTIGHILRSSLGILRSINSLETFFVPPDVLIVSPFLKHLITIGKSSFERKTHREDVLDLLKNNVIVDLYKKIHTLHNKYRQFLFF